MLFLSDLELPRYSKKVLKLARCSKREIKAPGICIQVHTRIRLRKLLVPAKLMQYIWR